MFYVSPIKIYHSYLMAQLQWKIVRDEWGDVVRKFDILSCWLLTRSTIVLKYGKFNGEARASRTPFRAVPVLFHHIRDRVWVFVLLLSTTLFDPRTVLWLVTTPPLNWHCVWGLCWWTLLKCPSHRNRSRDDRRRGKHVILWHPFPPLSVSSSFHLHRKSTKCCLLGSSNSKIWAYRHHYGVCWSYTLLFRPASPSSFGFAFSSQHDRS